MALNCSVNGSGVMVCDDGTTTFPGSVENGSAGGWLNFFSNLTRAAGSAFSVYQQNQAIADFNKAAASVGGGLIVPGGAVSPLSSLGANSSSLIWIVLAVVVLLLLVKR